MKKALLLVPTAVLLAGGALAWVLWRPSPEAPWKTVAVQRQDLEQLVTATGSLEAVVSVEVGTQVSGIVSEILVDFNDRVEAGQVVARIDRALLEADVRTAEAGLMQARAEAERAGLALQRTRSLHEHQAATDEELEAAIADADVAAATRSTREVALERARRNLSYATITSPITGTVVSRAVDVGQTVNAGLQAPTLFEIAQDLSRMQILAAVDEADIGEVAARQPARFTVQAYGDAHFEGSVRQVRLEPKVSENVVTYTVVIDVDNPDGRLLPGMTATVDIVTAQAEDVLCVPPSALRFQADREASAASESRSRLWVRGEQGLQPIPVEVGLVGDGCTQVTGEGLDEGTEVVTGSNQAGAKPAANASSSPFQQGGAGGGRRMGPPGGL
ncbi:MAG: efflux RND transporter periplasmic adaptor subunit [Deltaproteobacteria bacterium]|nr:efflux RND transporter periplasmic adaptor subunit [Deltaproteobacteria bacterium]